MSAAGTEADAQAAAETTAAGTGTDTGMDRRGTRWTQWTQLTRWPGRGGRRSGRVTRRVLPYAMLAPSLAVMLGLLGYPLVKLVILSFQDYGLGQFLGGDTPTWVGLGNYRRLLGNDQFVGITIRTIVLTAVLVVLTMVLGMLVATTMHRLDRVTRTAVSVGLLLAWATPQVGTVTIFRWMFNSQDGVVPHVLKRLHLIDLTGDHSVFLSATKTLAVVVIIVVWQSVPFVALTLHAGLSQVPRDLYEAARVDGAGPWQAFVGVTLPLLRPIVSLLIVLSLIWDLRLFNQIYVFNRGGPNGGSNVLGTYSYFTSIIGHEYGQGAAVALVLVVMALVLTGFHVRRLVRSGEAA